MARILFLYALDDPVGRARCQLNQSLARKQAGMFSIRLSLGIEMIMKLAS
jgi:hypothetical protein